MAKLRWGLIGASTIAAERMIGAFRANGVEAVAVMSTNADRVASYAKKHGIAHATTSLKERVDSKDIDGRPRPTDVAGVTNRFGAFDLGAFEMQPITDRIFANGYGDLFLLAQ